ncbi:HU family DNA-binding protein [Nitrosospira sp. Is2]|uniref:HU family DNA-binding protein n=1 Tax=Nitrosospira sp. Is2 TaxID=3080532 RepID=UPI002953CE11|nr:HU family DNA-binding protein [Nitrosospira sp. Is2]WON75321.1 HU family DNA-binding protein [Nitrosospira sp. Is2]
MTRKEFIQTMAAKTGANKADMEVTVGALLEVISDTLKKGDSLSFPGFGSFEVRERPAYKGRNPRTGEELQIKASRIPTFRAGATLKAAVNGK